jgi:hypothetical protein
MADRNHQGANSAGGNNMTYAPEKIFAKTYTVGDKESVSKNIKRDFHVGTNVEIPLFEQTEYIRTDVADAREVTSINWVRNLADTVNTQQARIKKLESAFRSILQIPNSDAAQGIMKAFAEDALGEET